MKFRKLLTMESVRFSMCYMRKESCKEINYFGAYICIYIYIHIYAYVCIYTLLHVEAAVK